MTKYEPKFQQGDRVRRINGDNCSRMKDGSVWTVIRDNGKWVNLEGYGREGFGAALTENFVLVSRAVALIKAGDTVRCIRPGFGRTLNRDYAVLSVYHGGRFFKRVNDRGTVVMSNYADNFTVVKKKLPLSVKVTQNDVNEVLTKYVKETLGIDATVTNIVQTFGSALELVLKQEAA
ncbi:hypothetical protein CYK37_29990 [Mesorhizobium loti]|nr:hypothetical protein [Mesorhizobium loti]PLP55523.1 hypothetical protein CYK37_29990 [Mesorhizobium loti]